MTKSRRGTKKLRVRDGVRQPVLPHQEVHARLAPSRIHGVGVFAIHSIPKGTRLFGEDDRPFSHVPVKVVADLFPELQQLYEDFCILRGEVYWCPGTFNELTLSWYLNHSNRPNVKADEEMAFFAARRVRRGEELTVDYRTYSDDPLPWLRRGSPPYDSRRPKRISRRNKRTKAANR